MGIEQDVGIFLDEFEEAMKEHSIKELDRYAQSTKEFKDAIRVCLKKLLTSSLERVNEESGRRVKEGQESTMGWMRSVADEELRRVELI